MNIAVLPFNATEGTEPALARQLSAFLGDAARRSTGLSFNPVNYLARIEVSGMPRFAHVNPSESLNELDVIASLFEQSGADQIIDGLLAEKDGAGTMTIRWFEKGSEQPTSTKEYRYLPGGMTVALREAFEDMHAQVGKQLAAGLEESETLFGTNDAEAFRSFLIGYDAAQCETS